MSSTCCDIVLRFVFYTINIRYWHICVVTKVPGFSASVCVMNLQDVDAIEIVKLFVGHGIQVRATQKSGEQVGGWTRVGDGAGYGGQKIQERSVTT